MLSSASRVAGLVAFLLIPQNIDTARQDGCCLFGLHIGPVFCYKLRFIFFGGKTRLFNVQGVPDHRQAVAVRKQRIPCEQPEQTAV